MKITPDVPKNESGLAQMIKMGKFIRQIWVKVPFTTVVNLNLSKCKNRPKFTFSGYGIV